MTMLFGPWLAAFLFLLGLVVGSFLNVVIARVPAGQSIVRPGSRCPRCGHSLAWFENVPLLSWLVLRARCRACRAPISARYPAVELLTGCLFLACSLRFGVSWSLLRGLLLVGFLVPLSFIDLDHWLLPFELTLPGLAVGSLSAALLGWDVLRDSLLGAAAGFLFFWGLETLVKLVLRKEGLGAGDKWLVALLGAFLGWQPLFGLVLLSNVQGAVVGSALLLFRGRAGPAPEPPTPSVTATEGARPVPVARRPEEEDDWTSRSYAFALWTLAGAGGTGVGSTRPLSFKAASRVARSGVDRRSERMRLRLAAIVFLVAVLATGLTSLSFQPLLAGLMEALRRAAVPGSAPALVRTGARQALPLLLGLDLLLVGVCAYAILWLAVARPVQRLEAELRQLERLDLQLGPRGSGGPLLSRVEASLRRTAAALQDERTVTHQQLDDLRLANEQLTRAQAELVAAERLATVGRLAAGVAHEVGNPLSGILGYLSLLRGAGAAAEAREYVDRIEAEVHRINEIVRGLLELGRPPRLTLTPVEVAPLVETSLRLVSAGPDFQGLDVRVDVTPGLLVLADAGPLSQVLINLLLNAAQAMGGRGVISVRARQEDARVRVDVLDSGPGIAPEVRPRLFEPFFTTKPGGKGTGLGLAVSESLVRSMGGTLEATDTPGWGSCSSVRLPAA